MAAFKEDPTKIVLGAGGTVGSQDWMKAALTAKAAGVRLQEDALRGLRRRRRSRDRAARRPHPGLHGRRGRGLHHAGGAARPSASWPCSTTSACPASSTACPPPRSRARHRVAHHPRLLRRSQGVRPGLPVLGLGLRQDDGRARGSPSCASIQGLFPFTKTNGNWTTTSSSRSRTRRAGRQLRADRQVTQQIRRSPAPCPAGYPGLAAATETLIHGWNDRILGVVRLFLAAFITCKRLGSARRLSPASQWARAPSPCCWLWWPALCGLWLVYRAAARWRPTRPASTVPSP